VIYKLSSDIAFAAVSNTGAIH